MKRFHVTVLTNAIVDILAHVENDFFHREDIERGSYRIVSPEEIRDLYERIPPATEQSGGSLANTAAALSALGGKACCLAKVSQDAFGEIFMHDMRAAGVKFPIPASASDIPTGRSIILIDEEGERSMNTDLGSSIDLEPGELCQACLGETEILCVEAYFWADARTKQTLEAAVEKAKSAGAKIAFGLSSVWCIETFKEEITSFIKDSVDIIFGNEAEYQALLAGSFNEILASLSGLGCLSVMTRGNQGSVIVSGDNVIHVPPFAGSCIIDVTGAGDSYAGGFLYGITHGMNLESAGRLGSMVAAETISHIGARPDQVLVKRIMKEVGLESV